MSAENTVEEKQSRRRRRRQTAEAEKESVLATSAAADIEEEDDDADDADDSTESRGVTQGKGRPTPGRRTRKDVEEEGNVVVRSVGGVREYAEDTIAEIRKITWPSWEDARRLTLVVLITVVIASLLLGLISVGFTELFRVGLSSPTILIGLFVVGLAIAFVFWFFVNRRRSSVN